MTYDEYLKKTDPFTGQAWEDFAKARGFTQAEMREGYAWQQRVEAMRNGSANAEKMDNGEEQAPSYSPEKQTHSRLVY